MPTKTVKKAKQTPAEQTANKQRIAQSKARAKLWLERQNARLLLENRPTTQPTQVVAPQDAARFLLENRPMTQLTQVVPPQDTIHVTVTTPVPWLGCTEDLIELFTRRAFFQENLDQMQRDMLAIDREIQRLIDPRF